MYTSWDWPPLTAQRPLMTVNGTPETPFLRASAAIFSTSPLHSSDFRNLIAYEKQTVGRPRIEYDGPGRHRTWTLTSSLDITWVSEARLARTSKSAIFLQSVKCALKRASRRVPWRSWPPSWKALRQSRWARMVCTRGPSNLLEIRGVVSVEFQTVGGHDGERWGGIDNVMHRWHAMAGADYMYDRGRAAEGQQFAGVRASGGGTGKQIKGAGLTCRDRPRFRAW